MKKLLSIAIIALLAASCNDAGNNYKQAKPVIVEEPKDTTAGNTVASLKNK